MINPGNYGSLSSDIKNNTSKESDNKNVSKPNSLSPSPNSLSPNPKYFSPSSTYLPSNPNHFSPTPTNKNESTRKDRDHKTEEVSKENQKQLLRQPLHNNINPSTISSSTSTNLTTVIVTKPSGMVSVLKSSQPKRPAGAVINLVPIPTPVKTTVVVDTGPTQLVNNTIISSPQPKKRKLNLEEYRKRNLNKNSLTDQNVKIEIKEEKKVEEKKIEIIEEKKTVITGRETSSKEIETQTSPLKETIM